jgi:hypothetical protein
MKQAHRTLRLLALAALVSWPGPATAEEIILKDGQKIVGTIVGYENNMFRLETDYGIALVRKDKVASIQLTKSDEASVKADAPKPSALKSSGEKPAPVLATLDKVPASAAPALKPDAEKATPAAPTPAIASPLSAAHMGAEKAPAPPPSVTKPETEKTAPAAPALSAAHPLPAARAAAEKAPAPQPFVMKPDAEKTTAAAPAPQIASPLPVAHVAAEKAPAPQSSVTKPETEKTAPAASALQIAPPLPTARATAEKASTQPAPPPPVPVSRPLDEPLPEHLQEHVEGSNYVNDTFQFSMFKPPDWKIYEGVPGETGSGIMAMGAEDEQTLLFVDRQVWSGPPNLTSDLIESKLRQTYQEYRKLLEESVQCDGLPAIRQTFTGVMDGAEWHGVAVHLVRGNVVFGIIGLTSAETFAFQQAVFGKIIKTFHFLTLPPPAPSPGAPKPSS